MSPGPKDTNFAIDILPLTPPETPTKESKINYPFDTSTSVTGFQDIISPETRPLVAVIGVGYVGTHLVSNFSRHWDVLGFDLSESRVQSLKSDTDFSANPHVEFTTSHEHLANATHYLISVPTLLLPDKTIDISYLKDALETTFKYARAGATIVIESSVAVGMTRELLGPLAKARGCFAGMSPERVDPGRTEPPARLIPKVISGLDDVCPGSLAAITRLYAPIFERLVPVSRPEVAEFTKLYENCQRMINIAYANEMADACSSLAIDPYEVCSAAASKPFGYMDYKPGLGVGGHCIPVNPWYLLSGCEMPLLRRSAETMNDRPSSIARKYAGRLKQKSKSDGRRARVLVVGVGFKKGQSTLSYSPGLQLARELKKTGHAEVWFADPLVEQKAVPFIQKLHEWSGKWLKEFDLVVVAMRQDGIDFELLEGLESGCVEWWCP